MARLVTRSSIAASDLIPNQFTFTDQTSVALSSTITSAAVTIGGLSQAVTFTASGGTIDKNSDGNFQTTQSLANGDTMRARVTSSGSNSTAVNCTVSAGGVSDTFSATTLSGSSEFAGRTPTHYVATTASGSGNGTFGNPWDQHQAMTQPVAGNIVGWMEGTYTRTAAQSSGDITIPCFNPTNSGSSGSPIIHVARYSAVDPATTSGLRTVLSNGDSTGDGATTFGAVGRNYITWDGFYCDENTSQAQPDGALAGLAGCTGSQLLNCWFIGADKSGVGSNRSGVEFYNVDSCLMENSIIEGVTDAGALSDNVACFHMWETRNSAVRHCTLRNSNAASYIKFDHGGTGFHGITIESNYVHNMTNHGFRFSAPSTVINTANFMRYNLFEDMPSAIWASFGSNSNLCPRNWLIENNTAVDCTNFMFYTFIESTAMDDINIRNNLADGGSRFHESDSNNNTTFSGWVTNGMTETYNGTRNVGTWFRSTSGSQTTPANAVSAVGLGQNGQQFGSDQFVNRAGGDYRLNTGVAALTASHTGGPIGCYITGSETPGVVV